MKKNILWLAAVIIIAGIIFGSSRDVNAGKANLSYNLIDKTSIGETFSLNDNIVCFYENDNYGGDSICISSNGQIVNLSSHYLRNSNKNWDNKISSVKIGKNACAIMYEHPNEAGYCLTLYGTGAGERKIPKLSAYNFNDKASHIKSLAYPNNYPPDPDYNQVFFFEHTNYDGYYLSLYINDIAHDLSNPVWRFNDQISSVKLGSNTCLTAWNDANYKGKRSWYKPSGTSVWRIPDLHSTGVGDKWSSLKVFSRDSCPN